MGCGCRKVKSKLVRRARGVRLPLSKRNTPKHTKKIKLTAKMREVREKQKDNVVQENHPQVVNKRKSVCVMCRFVTKTLRQKLTDTQKCLKANRSINALTRDTTFKCPIGNF